MKVRGEGEQRILHILAQDLFVPDLAFFFTANLKECGILAYNRVFYL